MVLVVSHEARMPTYLLTISYDGGSYAGWQRQDGSETVQGCLERAFMTIFGEPHAVYGAGRTDAGVHALRQCAHVRCPRAMAPDILQRALNGNLPRDILVRAVREVPADFHARFSAAGKRYAYRFLTSPLRPVFGRGYFWWVSHSLDLDAMREAAGQIVGEKDFASFASNPGYVRKHGTVRRVDHLHLVQRPGGIDLVIQGNGFLYNMVRAIAGTIYEIGIGRYPPGQMREIIEARDRRAAGQTAEPGGLYLVRVLYPPGILGS